MIYGILQYYLVFAAEYKRLFWSLIDWLNSTVETRMLLRTSICLDGIPKPSTSCPSIQWKYKETKKRCALFSCYDVLWLFIIPLIIMIMKSIDFHIDQNKHYLKYCSDWDNWILNQSIRPHQKVRYNHTLCQDLLITRLCCFRSVWTCYEADVSSPTLPHPAGLDASFHSRRPAIFSQSHRKRLQLSWASPCGQK